MFPSSCCESSSRCCCPRVSGDVPDRRLKPEVVTKHVEEVIVFGKDDKGEYEIVWP